MDNPQSITSAGRQLVVCTTMTRIDTTTIFVGDGPSPSSPPHSRTMAVTFPRRPYARIIPELAYANTNPASTLTRSPTDSKPSRQIPSSLTLVNSPRSSSRTKSNPCTPPKSPSAPTSISVYHRADAYRSANSSSSSTSSKLQLNPISEEAECPDGELEYDCGYLDLGAESPHSGSNSPYFGSSNPSGTEKQANAGSQKDPIEEESRPNGGQQEPASDGRSVASQATDQRLIREWAISIVAGKQGDAGLPPAIANIPLRSSRPSSRRGSVSGKKPVQKKYADRDCGICFEYAVKPSRTLCCSKIFCSEHLRDWLKGPNATGLCPNCDAPCSIDENTLSLASPTLRTGNGKSASTSPTSSRPPPSQQYERLMAQQHVPSSPLSTSAPITHHRRNSAEAVPVPASISTPRRSTGTGTGFSLYPGPPHTAAPGLERDCEANLDRHTIPFPFAPRSTNDSLGGESYVDLRKEGKSLTSEKDSEQGWSEDPSSFLSLPLSDCLGLDKEGRESTRPRTPSMWSTGTMGKAVLARAPGRKTSAFDTVFGPNADTFGSLAHLATLVAFVLLMYVVLA